MNLYKIKANSEGVVQSYGCLVEFILLLYPAILGVLQIIHLVYRYLLISCSLR